MGLSIDDLPPEILEMIFQELNLRDIGNCSMTCEKWEALIAAFYKDKGVLFITTSKLIILNEFFKFF